MALHVQHSCTRICILSLSSGRIAASQIPTHTADRLLSSVPANRMKPDYLLSSVLHQSTNAISYAVSHELAALFPHKAVVHGNESGFDFDAYVREGLCEARPRIGVLEHIVTEWRGAEEALRHKIKHGWYDVTWSDHALMVVLLTWVTDSCEKRFHWIVAPDTATGEAFFQGVCAWSDEVRGEVLVFEDGDWEKDADLFSDIKSATFENLILSGTLKQEIQTDFEQFLASRATYERYGLPWKRGVLLIGPPGNGKTHTLKALINALGQPCLYVKSFKSRYSTDHTNIRRVFQRARHTTPCLLVLEDLDSLVDDKNRSFFLNEMDGFASNTGIVVVATTNHPERLDVAIVERPSRFDRKYHFELPAATERLAYIAAWSRTLDEEMRLSDEAFAPLVEQTEGFSFAYLKELFVSSMMRWISAPLRASMNETIREQAAILRELMHSMNDSITPHAATLDDVD